MMAVETSQGIYQRAGSAAAVEFETARRVTTSPISATCSLAFCSLGTRESKVLRRTHWNRRAAIAAWNRHADRLFPHNAHEQILQRRRRVRDVGADAHLLHIPADL